MITARDVESVRALEARAMTGLPDGLLMQRAASALAATVADLLPRGVYGARVVLLVGGGNNGGDALWAGARLAARGARVDALLVGSSVHQDGRVALVRSGGHVHDCARSTRAGELGLMGRAEVVVDGVLGIGGRPGVAPPVLELLAAASPAARVVAVDLPSGVDPDTGETPAEHVRADLTVTFGVAKPALLLPPADRAAGEVVVVDIGLPQPDPDVDPDVDALVVERWQASDVAAAWPVPGPTDDKYSRGVLGVVAGGATYTGAAVLCTGAAVHAGAGMVRYVGPDAASDLVRARWAEVVPGAGRVQAWLLGPGVDADHDDEQRAAVRRGLADAAEHGLGCVVDAGALGLLPSTSTTPTLLTPHAGELARLLTERSSGATVERAEVEARPLHFARAAVEVTGATVLLKGATCVVVAPDGRVRAQPDGPHWLATAGSGDVLAGLCGALLAAGLDPLDAATAGVVLHGRAAVRANPRGPVHAEAVLAAVPAAVADLLS